MTATAAIATKTSFNLIISNLKPLLIKLHNLPTSLHRGIRIHRFRLEPCCNLHTPYIQQSLSLTILGLTTVISPWNSSRVTRDVTTTGSPLENVSPRTRNESGETVTFVQWELSAIVHGYSIGLGSGLGRGSRRFLTKHEPQENDGTATRC